MISKDDNLLTKEELAKLLGVTPRTIDRYLAKGFDLYAVRLPSGYCRFNPKKVQAAIERGSFNRIKPRSNVVIFKRKR